MPTNFKNNIIKWNIGTFSTYYGDIVSDCCVLLSLFYAKRNRFTYGYYFDYPQSSSKKKTGPTGYRFFL